MSQPLPPPPPTTDLERAVAVLNTFDTFDPQPERITDVGVLRRFVRWAGFPELAESVGEDDLPRFRDLRDRLRMAFEAISEAAAVEALNGVLAENATVSSLVHDGAGWRFRHRAADPTDPIAALSSPSAIALLSAIRDLGWSRLGTCSAPPCTCVFVDRTRNRSRRYCSDQCNDRMSQSAHRRRSAR
jgi:predicted RNA-binding Zn ribbon-like protein